MMILSVRIYILTLIICPQMTLSCLIFLIFFLIWLINTRVFLWEWVMLMFCVCVCVCLIEFNWTMEFLAFIFHQFRGVLHWLLLRWSSFFALVWLSLLLLIIFLYLLATPSRRQFSPLLSSLSPQSSHVIPIIRIPFAPTAVSHLAPCSLAPCLIHWVPCAFFHRRIIISLGDVFAVVDAIQLFRVQPQQCLSLKLIEIIIGRLLFKASLAPAAMKLVPCSLRNYMFWAAVRSRGNMVLGWTGRLLVIVSICQLARRRARHKDKYDGHTNGHFQSTNPVARVHY